MLGTVATLIAVIAVAVVGLMTLSGRLHWRRGLSVVVGCFVLFGAPTIASGFLSAMRPDVAPPIAVASPPPIIMPAPQPRKGYDPYGGAGAPAYPQ